MLTLLLAACSPSSTPISSIAASAEPKNAVVDCRGAGDFESIGDAIAAAVEGDEIDVAPCTYDERIDFGGKAVTLRAQSGPDDTIIDAGGRGPVVVVDDGEGVDTALVGFTLTGGSDTYGGAIYADFSSIRLENVRVTGNRGTYLVYASSADVEMVDVAFSGNRVTNGGVVIYGSRGAIVSRGIELSCDGASYGMYLAHGSAIVDLSDIACGGAYGTWWEHEVGRLQRTTVAGLTQVLNEDDHYEDGVTMENVVLEGLYVTYGTASVRNSVIIGGFTMVTGYTAVLESNVFMDAACAVSAELLSIPDVVEAIPIVPLNNVFWNVGAESCDGLAWSGTNGNLAVDPEFSDSAAGDYTLRAGSPCEDAGLEDDVYDDVDGSRNDIGVYGGPKSIGGGW